VAGRIVNQALWENGVQQIPIPIRLDSDNYHVYGLQRQGAGQYWNDAVVYDEERNGFVMNGTLLHDLQLREVTDDKH